MKTNYLLIDYENVQPKSLSLLDGHAFKVLVFVGASQGKVSIDIARKLQTLGNNAEYVQVSANGETHRFSYRLHDGRVIEIRPLSLLYALFRCNSAVS